MVKNPGSGERRHYARARGVAQSWLDHLVNLRGVAGRVAAGVAGLAKQIDIPALRS